MKDPDTAKAELVNDLDIAIHDATVELLDGRLHILADRFGITLDADVVAAIRDEFNAVYLIEPRDEQSVYVLRQTDGEPGSAAVALRLAPAQYTAWLVVEENAVSQSTGRTPLEAARAAFRAFDERVPFDTSAVSV